MYGHLFSRKLDAHTVPEIVIEFYHITKWTLKKTTKSNIKIQKNQIAYLY